MHSTSVNISNSLETDILARGPRCPKDTATQRRTESSEVSKREIRFANVGSSTSFGLTFLVSLERCSAAFVRAIEGPLVVWTLAIACRNCLRGDVSLFA